MSSLIFQNHRVPRFATEPSVDWNSYAQCYDLLCSLNPAYTELLDEFTSFCRTHYEGATPTILDLGGGTGNFFCKALPMSLFGASKLIHLDSDAEMLGIAAAKYKQHGLDVKMVNRDACCAVLPAGSLDCVLSVNALYAMADPTNVLRRVFHWLRPGGQVFLVDLGRIQNTNEWTSFLVKSNARHIGILRTLSILLNEGMVISKTNRRIADAQRDGLYWQHTVTEFRSVLEDIGFLIAEAREVYRGYSDLVIASKPSLR